MKGVAPHTDRHPRRALQVVHQSMATGLRTNCIEFSTDRGMSWDTAQERCRLEVRASNPYP